VEEVRQEFHIPLNQNQEEDHQMMKETVEFTKVQILPTFNKQHFCTKYFAKIFSN